MSDDERYEKEMDGIIAAISEELVKNKDKFDNMSREKQEEFAFRAVEKGMITWEFGG